MTLTNRMGRLFKADLHGLLDRLEEPEALLRQAVRDMECEIAQRDGKLGATRAEAARAGQRGERLVRELALLDQQLDLCLGSGKQDLAKGVVRKKLETERHRQALEARRLELTAAADRLGRELDDCREKLADVRRRMELFVAEAPAPLDGDPGRAATVTDDDVEIALLRERERRGQGDLKTTETGGGAR